MRVTASSEIAVGEHGPFVPLPRALLEDARLRDELAGAIPLPSLRGLARVRAACAALAAFPLALALWQDRASGPGALVLDASVLGFTARELARPTPRLPRITAAALLAVALRFVLVAVTACGRGVGTEVWASAGLALASGALWLAKAPPAARVALDLAGKLGLERSDLARARPEEDAEVSGALFGATIAAAVGLPAVLFVARRAHLALGAQAAVLVAYAAAVPTVVRRVLDGGEGGALARARARELVSPLALLAATTAGLVAASALVGGGDAFMKGGTELARCVGKLDAEGRRLALAQAREVAEAASRVRASTWLAIVAVTVVPLAEERVYRGLLLPVLVRRYGRAYALFATSLAFAFAHAGVYEIAAWQTAMAGFAFGVAYLEGGLVAAFAAHALWNLFQLV